MKIKKLKKEYEIICNIYVKKFSKKQKLQFDGWIADDVGSIASFIDQYFFNLEDLIIDLESKQKKGFILKWQDDTVEYNMKNKTDYNINYKSYIMGLRYENLENNKKTN